MRLDRRLIAHFEWPLALLALAIAAAGVTTIYSASHSPGDAAGSPFAVRQLTWLAAGTAGMLAMLAFDYRRLERHANLIYLGGLIALLAVPLVGRSGGGAQRWLALGPVSIQPSEFVKLALVIALARHLADARPGPLGLREAIVPLALTVVPCAAILAQPDLGTVAVIGIVALTMLVVGGV